MSADLEWMDWLRLVQTPGVGGDTARKLLSAVGLPSQIFKTEFAVLRQLVSDRIARVLVGAITEDIAHQIEVTACWLQQSNHHIVHLADAHYPKALLEIPDPPVLLYVKGRLDLLSAQSIAVVGSRNATRQGVLNAEKLSESLSHSGIVIVSGLAAGIDAAAHQGGLRGVGSTIAVVGTGLDLVYPASNRGLACLLAQDGCIVSEYALGTPPIASNFPRRNRIISGLTKGVVVIEAAAQSGSLITARLALEQGREVFALPGSVHSPLAKGCHQLIKQGAKLVESAQDILEEIQFDLPQSSRNVEKHSDASTSPASVPGLSEANLRVLSMIGFDPVHIEVLATELALAIADLSAELCELELLGTIENLPGGYVQRCN
ncbi:MAG: DNA-processing protein DprA [Undibacterium sp.]|nr:DNA-processing protein DprA [Undibacterium sp.]